MTAIDLIDWLNKILAWVLIHWNAILSVSAFLISIITLLVAYRTDKFNRKIHHEEQKKKEVLIDFSATHVFYKYNHCIVVSTFTVINNLSYQSVIERLYIGLRFREQSSTDKGFMMIFDPAKGMIGMHMDKWGNSKERDYLLKHSDDFRGIIRDAKTGMRVTRDTWTTLLPGGTYVFEIAVMGPNILFQMLCKEKYKISVIGVDLWFRGGHRIRSFSREYMIMSPPSDEIVQELIYLIVQNRNPTT